MTIAKWDVDHHGFRHLPEGTLWRKKTILQRFLQLHFARPAMLVNRCYQFPIRCQAQSRGGVRGGGGWGRGRGRVGGDAGKEGRVGAGVRVGERGEGGNGEGGRQASEILGADW